MTHALPTLHLLCAAIYGGLAAYVLARDPREALNRVCAVLFSCFLVWCVCKAVTHDAALPAELARYWLSISALPSWTFAGFLLWFVLLFSRAGSRRRINLVVGLVFVVPVATVLKHWLVGGVLDHELRAYGWGLVWLQSPWATALHVYFFVTISAAIALLAWTGARSRSARRRRQAWTMFASTLLAFGIGFPTNIVLPRLGVPEVPDLAHNTALILAVGLAYAIARHDLMEISPTLAAEKILSTMSDALLLLDPEGRIVTVNRATTELLGVDEQELVGVSASALLVEGEGKTGHALVKRIREGGIRCHDTAVRGKGAAVLPVSLSTAAIEDDDGTLSGYVCIARDITDRKQAEALLERARDELEQRVRQRTAQLAKANEELIKAQKLESLGVLAGGIAHDFNNILVGISVNLGLARSLEPEPAVMAVVEEAEGACHQASTLTQQLLTFSLGGSPVKEVASIAELLQETAEFVLRGSKCTADHDIAPDLWAVEADAGQMGQCIQNLAVNAVQAMPDGGVLRVRARNELIEAGSDIPVEPGRYVAIQVQDAGSGIAPEHLAKVFDPYFTTKPEGSGLGLATTYSIIRGHKGHIEVASVPGEGTTFSVFLPAVGEVTRAETPKRAQVVHGRGRILVMDDQHTVRRALGRALSALGYDATLTADGDEAVRAYRGATEEGRPFDLCILDLVVSGGLGGKEALEMILAEDPKACALVSSGYSNDPVMSDHERFGFRGVVRKPYTLEQLGEVIRSVME